MSIDLAFNQFDYCKQQVEANGIAFANAYAVDASKLAISYYRSTGAGPYVQWQPVGPHKTWLTDFDVFTIVADGCVKRVVQEWM